MSVFKSIERIAQALEYQSHVATTILDVQERMLACSERAEQRAIEAHAKTMEVFSLTIEREKRVAATEKENEERYKNLVSPFIDTKFTGRKENENEN